MILQYCYGIYLVLMMITTCYGSHRQPYILMPGMKYGIGMVKDASLHGSDQYVLGTIKVVAQVFERVLNSKHVSKIVQYALDIPPKCNEIVTQCCVLSLKDTSSELTRAQHELIKCFPHNRPVAIRLSDVNKLHYITLTHPMISDAYQYIISRLCTGELNLDNYIMDMKNREDGIIVVGLNKQSPIHFFKVWYQGRDLRDNNFRNFMIRGSELVAPTCVAIFSKSHHSHREDIIRRDDIIAVCGNRGDCMMYNITQDRTVCKKRSIPGQIGAIHRIIMTHDNLFLSVSSKSLCLSSINPNHGDIRTINTTLPCSSRSAEYYDATELEPNTFLLVGNMGFSVLQQKRGQYFSYLNSQESVARPGSSDHFPVCSITRINDQMFFAANKQGDRRRFYITKACEQEAEERYS